MSKEMTRTELGLRLMNWHSSQNDPIYAVGSLFFDDQVCPKDIVEDCLFNLNHSLDEFQRMQKGEVLMVRRYGGEVDLRKFAGYTDEEIEENISDLTEIVSEVKRFLEEDYQ